MQSSKLRSATDEGVYKAITAEIVDWEVKNQFLKDEVS